MDKAGVIEILESFAVLLELKGENPFKVRAYQNAARALEGVAEDLETQVGSGRLPSLPGIGKEIAKKIETLAREGRLEALERLKESVPAGLLGLREIPGLGAKKIKVLWEKLGVTDVDSLRRACEEGRVATLAGFGPKTQANLLQGIRDREAFSQRHLWALAARVAFPVVEGLKRLPEVLEAGLAGSFRRRMETVGDLDFLVASEHPESVMEWFCAQEGVERVLARGSTKSSVWLKQGMQADLRVLDPRHFGAALHYFTGSKEHNVAMRQAALRQKLSLSEWGFKAIREDGTEGEVEPVATEEDVFRRLGMEWIPPELREGSDELELAREDGLPELLESTDIRGLFHNHTHASDGVNSLEEMALAARNLGMAYLGIADHSRSSVQAGGLNAEEVIEQAERIARLNEAGELGIHLFSGIECDILPDGNLDLPNGCLARLDYVVASVHSAFGQDEETMTRRIIRALEHPLVTMLGHLTGRLLLRRKAYQVNVVKVIDAAAANGKVIELNANPRRLDMDWRHWRHAASKGVLCSINPDAHTTDELGNYVFGVQVARKGGLGPAQVLNTRSLEEVSRWLAERRGR